MNKKYKLFKSILTSSHSFDLETNGELTVESYWTGEKVTVDLYRISEEVFEKIVVENDDDYEDEWED